MDPLTFHPVVDLVYSPEIVDKSIIGAVRLVNEASGTIDYIKEGKLVFRTHPAEKDRLVFQLGSADPLLALQAALTVQEDVAAFDLNCGCPKRFSLQAGMGAALLKAPDLLVGVLENLLAGTDRPVSAKIRLFLAEEGTAPYTFTDTHVLVKRIIETGVSAIAIHARDPTERSEKHPAHWNLFLKLAETVKEANESLYGPDSSSKAALILNGDVGLKDFCSFEREWSLSKILEVSGASSVMSARAVQWNPLCLIKLKESLTGSLFRPSTTLLPIDEKYSSILATESISPDCLLSASRRFLVFAQSTNNPFTNTKYVLLQIWNTAGSQSIQDPEAVVARNLARNYAVKVQQGRSCAEFAEIFNVPWIESKDNNNYSDLEE